MSDLGYSLHRIRMCPLCGAALKITVETELVTLYCYPHGYFEIRYIKGDWSIDYKFATDFQKVNTHGNRQSQQ